MKNINIRRLYYHVRHNYLTTNNLVVVVGLLVAAGWVWGSIQAMERNYGLQKEVDSQRQQLQLAQLETAKLKFEQNYFKSDEYKELAIRKNLGLVNAGEKVLILPPNSEAAKAADAPVNQDAPRVVQESNLQQWINFLFGGASRGLQP